MLRCLVSRVTSAALMTCTLPSLVAILYCTFGVCSTSTPFHTLPSDVSTTSRYSNERVSTSSASARADRNRVTITIRVHMPSQPTTRGKVARARLVTELLGDLGEQNLVAGGLRGGACLRYKIGDLRERA